MDNVRVLLKAIVVKEDKFLTLKRPLNAYSRPNCWDFPGGNLEFGENMGDCLIREIKEETSLQVKDIKPLHIISALDSKKKVFWIEIGYTCRYHKGKVKLSSEHTEYKWVNKNEFLKLKSADYLIDFVRHL